MTLLFYVVLKYGINLHLKIFKYWSITLKEIFFFAKKIFFSSFCNFTKNKGDSNMCKQLMRSHLSFSIKVFVLQYRSSTLTVMYTQLCIIWVEKIVFGKINLRPSKIIIFKELEIKHSFTYPQNIILITCDYQNLL